MDEGVDRARSTKTIWPEVMETKGPVKVCDVGEESGARGEYRL